MGPDPEMLDAAGPLDGLVVASPSNPTGTVLDAGVLEQLRSPLRRARHAPRRRRDLSRHHVRRTSATLLAATERAIVVNSFSKYFSMTGWRVGWVVMPDDLAGSIERLQQNLYICAPHVSQIAALGALDATAELDGHVDALPRQPRRADRRSRIGRHRPHRRRRRRVLRVRRRVAPHRRRRHRLAHALPPLARRDRRGDDTGHRLRSRSRRSVRALLVRRAGGRRSPAPASSSPVGRSSGDVDTPSRPPLAALRVLDLSAVLAGPELRALPRRLRRRRHQGRAPRRRHPPPPGMARPTRRRRPVVEARQPQQAHDRPRPQGRRRPRRPARRSSTTPTCSSRTSGPARSSASASRPTRCSTATRGW